MHKFCLTTKRLATPLIVIIGLLLSPASYALGLLELKLNAPLVQQASKYFPTSIVYPKVQANESLREIADKIRPDHITTEQMMLSLQRENPSAFYQDNVSYLNAGVELRIKDISTLDNISAEDAKTEIENQYQAWLIQWRQRAAAKKAKLQLEQAPVIAQVVPSSTTVQPIAVKSGQFKKDSINENKPLIDGAGLESEEKTTLLGRLEALEGKMVKVQSLIQLREKVIEQISREHRKFTESFQERDKQTTLANTDAESKLEKEKQENIKLLKRLSVLESDIAVIQGLIELRDSVLQNQEINVQQLIPAVTPVVTQRIITENRDDKMLIRLEEPVTVSNFSKNNQFLFSFLVALLFIGACWFIVHKRSHRIQQALIAENTVKPGIDKTEQTAAPVEVIKFNRTNTSMDSVEAAKNTGKATKLERLISNEMVLDPLTEADVYLTYEKYDEAETLLHKAITREPYRQELKLKLLEVFALSRNIDAFDNQASILFAAISKQDEEYLWQHALLMAKDLDTKNPLFLVNDNANDCDKMSQSSTKAAAQSPPVKSEHISQDVTDIDLEEAMSLFNSEAVDDWGDEFVDEDVNDIVSEAIEHASKHSVQSIQSSKQIALNSTYFADNGADNKLDLAKAYIEMGDHIGALDLLSDVLKEGTTKQKVEAKDILAID